MQQRQHDPAGLFDRLQYDQSDTPQGRTVIDQLKQRPVRPPPPVNVPPMEPAPPAASPEPTPEPVGGVFSDMLASAPPQQQSLPTEPAQPAGGIFSDLLASTPGQPEAPNPAPEPAGGVFSDLIPQQPTTAQPDISRYMPWDQPDILPELSAVDPRAITAGLIAEESDYEQQLQDRALAEKARFYERRMAGPKTQLPEPKLPERDFDTLVGHYRNGVSYIRPNEYSKILNAIEEGKSTPEQEGQFTQFIEPNLDADQKRELNIARLTRDKYLEKQARLDEFYAEKEPPKSALEWEERRPQIKTTEADDAALTALIKGASFNYLLGPDEDRLNSDNPEDVADERANQLIIRKQAEKYPGSTLWGSLLGTMAPTTALTGALRAGRLAWAGRGLQAGPPTAQTAGILARGGAPATTGGMIGENLLTGAAYDIASRPEGSENMTPLENLQARLDVTGFGAMAGILGDLALGQIAKGADFAKARADAFKDKRTRNQLNTFATQNGFKDFDDMAENVMEIIDTPEGPVMRLKKSVYDGMAERDIPSSNVNEQLRQPADINQYRELMAQQSEQARQLAARPETAHAKEPATVTPAGTTEAGVPPTPPETAPVPPAAGRTDTATAEPLTPQRPAPVRDERLSNPNYQDHLLQYPEYRDYLESALWEAREAQKPVTKKNRVTKLVNDDDTLLTAAMKLGGIDKTTLDDTIVESINAHLSNKPKFNRTMRAAGKGSTLDDMARKLAELGYTRDGREMTANELADAIDQETRGRPYFSDAMEDFSAHYEQGSNIASNNATIPTLEAALRGEPLTPAYRKEMARLLADTEADPNFTQPVDVQYEQAGIRTGEPLPPTGPAYDPDFYDVLDDYHDLIARDTGIDLKSLDADDLTDIREMERQLQLKDAESFERELYDIADDSTESIFGGLIYGHPDQTAKTPGGEVPEQLAPQNRQTDLETRTETATESSGRTEPARPGADISQYRRIISDERERAAQIPPSKPETTAPTAAEKPPDFDLATHTEADLTTRAREQETAQQAEQRTEQQARTKAAADREVAGFEFSVQGSGKHVPASQGDLLGTGRTPPSKPETKPETADDLLDVSPDDIDYNRAYEAYVHSSHSPKRRANYEQEEYVLVMRDLADELGKLATTPEQRTLLKQELAKYKEGYLKRKHDLLDAKARTTSPLVTGGANYNVGRQGKRMDAADRIREDFLTWQEKEKRRIIKALQTPQARKPKPVSSVSSVSSESVTPKKQEVTKETAAEQQYKPITNTPDTSKKDLKGGPYTVSYHNEMSNALTTGELSLSDFQAAFGALIDNKEEILARLNKYKKANLMGMANKVYFSARDVTKADAVNDVWDRLLRRYLLDKEMPALHYDPFADAGAESSLAAAKVKREKGIIDTVNKLTQQDLEDYAAKFAKRRAELDQMKSDQQARMETPETLDDYELIVKNKGESALTPAQKAEYERLQAERDWQAREQKVQKANVKEGLQSEQEIIVNPITEGTHGKTGQTIYNVNLETRLGKEKFKEAANMAKSMKGGYWRGNFYFKTMEDAEQFTRWLQGDTIDRSGAKMEQEAAKATSRADKLRTMADRLEKTGTEELNAPRTTNTARQMDMASRSRSKASKQIRFAQTLRNIANGMDDGSVQFLSKLDSQTQLELLESIQRRSIPESMMESDFNGYSMSRTVKDGITLDDYVDHIHYPKARLHRDYLRTLITDMKGKRGYARPRNELETLYSIAARNDKHLIDLNPELTESISAFSKKHGTDPGWQFTDNLADIKRLQKMGITNDAQLRTAIRELDGVKSREGIETSAERKLDDMRMKIKRNARNYNDFFPTPDHVTARVMELADVQPGHKTLEPNAGMGHMAGKLRELAGAAHVDMVEISTDLADYLKQMGYTVDRSDFMTLERADTYDRIVMNPPFSKNQDIDHVQHAYTMLKPGGRLTAIVSNMAGIRSDSKNRAFSTWLDNVGAHVEDVEAGAFKSSFNPTGVNTKILVIEKPLVEVEPGKLREHAVNADEYHMADAEQAFQHSNRSAAKAYRDRFVKDVQEAYDAAATKAETPEQIEALNNAIGQYKKDYLAAEKEYFTVRQGVASHHIAGRNKFDSSQAERRGRADDLAHDRMTSRMESARYKVEQAVQDARTPEQQAKDLAGQQQAAQEKARFNHLKDVAGYIGEVADHIRNNRTESARDARKWAMPKAYEAAQRGLNEDRAWTIDTLKKMDEQLSDVGGLLKVAGPRSKMGKLYKELSTEGIQSAAKETTSGTLYSNPFFAYQKILGLNPLASQASGALGAITASGPVDTEDEKWYTRLMMGYLAGSLAGGGLHKVLTGSRFRVKGATVIGEGDSWGGRTLDWLGKQWRKVPGMSTGDPDIMPLKKQQELMKLVIERQAEKAGEYLLKNFTPSQRAKMADLIETRGIVKDGGLLHRQAEELDEFISYTAKKLQELGMLSEDIEPGGYLHRYYEKDLGLGNMLKGLTPKGKTLSGSWSRRRGTQEVVAPEYLSQSVRETLEQVDTLNNEAQALRKKSGDMLDADTSERLANINKELKQLQSIEFVEYLAPQNGRIQSFFFARDEVPHIPGMEKPGTGAPATASQLGGMKRAPGKAPLVGQTGSMSKTDRVWTLDGREPAGAAILHRDWTKAEREQWGEINDAAYRMVRGQAEVAHDLSLGHFFKTVHDRFKGTKVSDKETPGWIQVPETRIGKGSRMNRYGALAGKYVTKDVWDAIRHHGRNPLLSLTNNHPAVKTYLNALGKWKAYKTVYNPVSHMNNAISNLQMYYLSDNDRKNIGEAAKALWQKERNTLYREAQAAGLFGQGWTSTLAQSGNAKEIDSLLERLRTQPETDDFTESVDFVMELKRHFIESAASINNAKGPWKTGAALGKAIGKPLVMPLKKPINAAASAAESAYRLEEDLFKLAVFASERAKGKSGFDAVRESEKYFFNYNDMPDAMKMVRDFPIGSPFISYTYFAIPAIARTIVEKPERVLALMAGLEAFNYTAQAINGELQETGYWDRYTAENELVPGWMQGRTMWGGLNNVSIPFVESYKLSLANANAGGNPFVGQSERPGAWPGMLQAWGPGWEGSNPMIRLLSDITRNEDWRGNPIWKEAAPTSEKVRKAANYIYQNITPSNVLTPGSYHQQKVLEGLANQVRKAEDEGEEPNALVESMVDLANATSNLLGGGQFTGLSRAENEILTRDALLGSLGLKLRPMHIEQFFDSKAWEIRQGIEQQKKYLRGQGRLEYENRITSEQMERYERIAEDRIDDLSEQFKRLENAKNVVNL